MERMRTKVAAVLVAGLVLGAGACGGGSKNEESSNEGALTAEVETTTTTRSSGNGSSSNSDDMNDALDAIGGDCFQAGIAYFALSMQALGAAFGATESDLAEMQSSIDELQAEIPSAIEDDFKTYADALEEYGQAMKGMDMSDLMSGSSQAEDAAKILETPDVKEAQSNIEAYFDQNCPS